MDQDLEYWLKQGEATAQNPGGWLYTAEALKRSADILLAASDEDRRKLVEAFSKENETWSSLADELADLAGAPFLWPVYLQLAGLATENVAKGRQQNVPAARGSGCDRCTIRTASIRTPRPRSSP
jgi:hypothetical protein